jgi:hypothetical protein
VWISPHLVSPFCPWSSQFSFICYLPPFQRNPLVFYM